MPLEYVRPIIGYAGVTPSLEITSKDRMEQDVHGSEMFQANSYLVLLEEEGRKDCSIRRPSNSEGSGVQ